jgi:hypothetical protein
MLFLFSDKEAKWAKIKGVSLLLASYTIIKSLSGVYLHSVCRRFQEKAKTCVTNHKSLFPEQCTGVQHRLSSGFLVSL